MESLGKQAEAAKLAQDALATFELIESPAADNVRRQLAEWRG